MNRGAKPVTQARSKRTRDAIIDALEDLLRTTDFQAISVAAIAERAGVSPATIYQRFTNDDAAVAVLLELYMRAVPEWTRANGDAVKAIFAAPSLREAMVELGETVWRQCDELGHVMRPAYLYSRLRPDLLGEQWRIQLERTRADFRMLLEGYRGEIRRSDLTRAASMLAAFYNTMFVGLLLHRDDQVPGSDASAPSSAEAFAIELADFACGYLKTPETPLPTRRRRRKRR